MATLSSSAAAPAFPNAAGEPPKGHAAPLAVLTGLFFVMGFLTCLNDIIIPHLKAVFELSYVKAMLIQFAFFTAYAVTSIPSGGVVRRLGYKGALLASLGTMAVGCLLFYPAAGTRSYELFLVALFVLASGVTLLQVAVNPFVAVLGKPETASSRLTMTQAFNSLGTTVAPQFGSLLILGTAVKSADELARLTPTEVDAYRVAEAASVQLPYLGLAATLVVVAVVLAAFRLPNIDAEHNATAGETAGATSLWRHRRLVFGAAGIFFYVGGEVAIGSFLVNFLSDPDIGGLTEGQAARYISFYWGAAMVGRFIGTATLRRFEPRQVLTVHAVAAAALVIAAMVLTGHGAMWAILAVGLANSIMFPTIFTLAIHGLGRDMARGSGILCTAIVGGAIVPVVQGALADSIGVQQAFLVPLVCYAYITWYALRGSR
jgi:FHS family L-fucose permease-like MFS transporter